MNRFYRTTRLILATMLLVTFQGILMAQPNAGETARENYQGPSPKYIFYFIGDGFGLSQSNASEAYLAAIADSPGIKKLEMNQLPYQAFFTTYALNRFITGSAAAGTALATGHKTTINTVGMDGKKQTPLKSVAEMARDKGWKVGIISSVSLDHATPASFYAHQPSRNMYYQISKQLTTSGFNYFAGGGLMHPEGDGKIDNKNTMANIGMGEEDNASHKQTNAMDLAKQRGYSIINSKEEFLKLKNGDDNIIAISPNLAGGKSMPYAIDQTPMDISLPEFTQKGIELLNNPKGFLIMVEGGKIDWACHANDAATAIKETLQMDEAVAKAMEFYRKNPDETLIVVAGDHETGGMALGFSGSHYHSDFRLLQHQTISYEVFANMVKEYQKSHQKSASVKDGLELVEKYFGLGDASKDLQLTPFEKRRLEEAFKQSMLNDENRDKDDQYYLLYGNYDPLTVTACHLLSQKAGIGWTSYSHTASPIPVRAMGCGANLFSGFLDNTDLAKNLMRLMNIK